MDKHFDMSRRGHGNRSLKQTAKALGLLLCCCAVVMILSPVNGETVRTYVGSKACAECHEEEYEKFKKFAKKSHSFQSVKKMAHGLTKDEIRHCFECHTTGYGMPGGFVSEEKTPHLKDAGCEVCHGPGSLHAETEDAGDIRGSLSSDDCATCHSSERITAFNYKPLVYGGAH